MCFDIITIEEEKRAAATLFSRLARFPDVTNLSFRSQDCQIEQKVMT